METTQSNNPPLPLGQKGQQIDKSVSSNEARFFVVHREEGSFETVSPFLIHRLFTKGLGELKSIKKLRSGDLLVEVHNSDQASKLRRVSIVLHTPVVISAHGSLNFSRGVISEGELLHVSDEEILEGLKEQHVCGVRRITIRRDGKILPTKHLILTFDSPSLPSHIKAGYLRCPVRPFIPNPLRCFNCQRFGHSKASCRGSLTCPRCAEVGHDGEGCQATLKCVNCKGDHTSFSRTCPKWLLEKEVQAIKVKEGISYPAARKLVAGRTPRSGLSYAAALKSYSTIGTQTDLSSTEKQIAPTKMKQSSSDESHTSNKSVIQKPKFTVHNPKKESTAKKSVSPSKKTQSDPVEKPSPLSVESVFRQKPLNPPSSNATSKPGKRQNTKNKNESSGDTSEPGWRTTRNVKKYEKKRLKTYTKNYDKDPPLELYVSEDETCDEMEVALSPSSSAASDPGGGDAQGPA